MVKQTIEIFARVKPTKAKKGHYELDTDADGCPKINFAVPKDLASGYINNKKETYKFRFTKIFDQPTAQDEIFENVAKPVIDNVLKGYNGTIFAYGQTGSGKTFTITGGPERFADRGIIPRTLSYIFDYYEQNSADFEFTTHVSYLEIYNENGYDLLDPKHEATKLEDLPKVSLMEDADQNIHLKNLSTHQATNEEDALNLLFLGDTNRMIAETPMNQASTRSHCIFTIHITSREQGSATIRRSKLHLVDLAGSERVSKTGVNGILLTEAKYINLSLHYLEQVIVALSEKTRQHIPYRNSMMTSVLRDSLGGNSLTTMIATLSVEKKNIDESISTCRFAQRVAMIKNDAILNEELDPKLLIAKLKREVQQLKEELAMVTGEQRTDDLTAEELQRCERLVDDYLADRDPDAVIPVGSDMRKIQQCYKNMKQRLLERPASGSSSISTIKDESVSHTDEMIANSAQVQKLQELMKQRDNEINILVKMLKKEKKKAADAEAVVTKMGGQLRSASTVDNSHRNEEAMNARRSTQPELSMPDISILKSQPDKGRRDQEDKTQKKVLGELSKGRQEAFEIFRRDYKDNPAIEQNKETLRKRYQEAKQLGEVVNTARAKINKLKTSVEQHRMMRAMQGLVDADNPEADEMELDMRSQIEQEKLRYKDAFQRLKTLKTEIEHLQHLLEKSKVKLMKDFELWWAEQASEAQETSRGKSARSRHRNAWESPKPSDLGSSHSSTFTQHTSHQTHHPPRETISSTNYSAYNRNTPIQQSNGNIPLTGDPQADADIMAFLKARKNILQKVQQQGQR